MLASMFSGISGLKVNQQELDVIGNNIANSGTTAYKSQRTRFEDMISQTINQATGANTNTGGTNNMQVGLGVQLAGIDTMTATGSMQPTSRNLDFAIDGAGYFVVGSGALPGGSNSTDIGTIETDPATHALTSNGVTTDFTRDGSFTLDSQGNLLTSNGQRVYGYANDNATITYSTDVNKPHAVALQNYDSTTGAVPNAINDQSLVPLVIPNSVSSGSNNLAVQSFSVGKDGLITATLSDGSTASLGQIAMTSFKNDAGLTKVGNNMYNTSANSGEPVVRSKVGADPANDNSKGYGDALQGMLEMSNVDLAEQFSNMIVASRAFQANGKIITTGDEILQDLVNLKR